jgi:hypothetical protein
MIGAMAAVIGGTVVFGSNTSTLRMSASDVALELSRHIREQFAARYRRAA